MVNDPKVFSLFSTTNARIYQVFLGIDNLITQRAQCKNAFRAKGWVPMAATWGSAYKAWMTDYITDQDALITRTTSIYSTAIPTVYDPIKKAHVAVGAPI